MKLQMQKLRRVLRRPPKESLAENVFTKQVRGMGLLVRKMNGLGYRDWPDRLVVGPKGFTLWVEFKREKQSLSPGQHEMMLALQARGQNYTVAYTAAQALAELHRLLKLHGNPSRSAPTSARR